MPFWKCLLLWFGLTLGAALYQVWPGTGDWVHVIDQAYSQLVAIAALWSAARLGLFDESTRSVGEGLDSPSRQP
jgi:lipid-A-disaccharide synthase-like uncharacterized protein